MPSYQINSLVFLFDHARSEPRRRLIARDPAHARPIGRGLNRRSEYKCQNTISTLGHFIGMTWEDETYCLKHTEVDLMVSLSVGPWVSAVGLSIR